MRWLLPLAAAALLVVPTFASAYQVRVCNGRPVGWNQARAPIDIDTCSVPRGSRRSNAVWYALTEWNSIGGAPATFEVGERGSCGMRHGDRQSTIGYVAPEHVDGALGLTRRYYSAGCWRWSPRVEIIETDIMLSDRIDDWRAPLANIEPEPVCDAITRPRATERATLLHELGHALGLGHEDDHLSMMMTRHGEGRFCGARPFMPHPDDVAGARRIYGDGTVTHELAASVWRWTGPDAMDRVHALFGADARRAPIGCPGDLFRIQYSVANLGTRAAGYHVWWYASRDDEISPDDLLVSISRADPIGAQQFLTRDATVRLSSRMIPGVDYRLGFVIDPAHDWRLDRRQGNNAAFITAPMRIRAECP